MDVIDDEIISMFIEESRAHLSDIESDLLTVEGQGAAIDRELVNKVFRAAHSIKGGAGFLNLVALKELSHKIENVLDLIRNGELVPTPEIISTLLISFDKLREMINNIAESDRYDISGLVSALALLVHPLPVAGGLDPASAAQQEEPAAGKVPVFIPGGDIVMEVDRLGMELALKGGASIYLLDFDLIHDVHQMWRTPLDLIRALDQHGTMLESMVSLMEMGTLDNEPLNRIPFYVILACEMEKDALAGELGILPSKVIEIACPGAKAALAGREQATAPASETSTVTATPTATAPKGASGSRPEPSSPAVVAAPRPLAPAPAAPATPATTRREETPKPVGGSGAVSAPPPSAPAEPVGGNGFQPETTLRINVSLLDTLMNLAGELVLTRNQLLQAIQRNDQPALKAAGYRINAVTSELQESIMLTRMQPIGNIFNKFTRIVRDLSRNLGKEIQLEITGKEVELDKTIIEGLSDPLTHLVRNSIDHGIELPDERRRAGKTAGGTVQLHAYHEAGQVIIEIRDDGKGIDPEKVAQVAAAKGVITQDQVRTMTDKEKRFLIMMPGFSTAEQVTDISGRGVGMDVVKTNIEKLNGQVDIDSEVGRGSVFRIKLPLTLAIIPCLFVETGGQHFALPQVSVVEAIRIGAAQVQERIVRVGDADLLMLRGEIIPIIHLGETLGLDLTYRDKTINLTLPDRRTRVSDRRSKIFGEESGLAESDVQAAMEGVSLPCRSGAERRYNADSDLNLVIVSTGIMQYALVVQRLHDSEEIVVKALGRHLKHIKGYAGATIMGDGRVALILDAAGLAESSGIMARAGAAKAELLSQDILKDAEGELQALLTFYCGDSQQLAVPLELVARVEKIVASDVELVGGKRVMQYRGQILPLVEVADVASITGLNYQGDLVVIVFEVAGREVGLVANNPVDSVERRFEIDSATLRQTGILGSVILDRKTVMIVDIFELVERLHPEWFEERRKARGEVSACSTVLLAEDSDFFRMQVKKFMEDEGYQVVECDDGETAWEALKAYDGKINVVVTDIEMPRMNGYELTRRIREDARFRDLPVIAVTSLAADEDMERGMAVGMNSYLVKLDREKLIESISSLCR